MDNKKPILLFFENLVEPIFTADAEFALIESALHSLDREFLIKGTFAYVFALFESSLSECLKRYLSEIPSKVPMQDIALKKHRDRLISSSFVHRILDSFIDDYIINVSYGTLDAFLQKFCELLAINNNGIVISDKLNEKKERRNLLLHNNLTINNKYIENTKASPRLKGTKLKISKEYLVETITEIKEVTSAIILRLSEKYSKFTKVKAVKDIWDYLFDSPILN